ncbi:Cas1p-domain-containing protein [Ascobolus immersus RN42]|uniref:Cas1p-domain-containing protein n=1 Tax=Ascobolus immersus RN42 TaxID=1160509 RepID=A0A3N4HBU8_ASCIM|nr:Cas1p-domain-containing protein [Ascobolus immersus RN42]
MVRFARLQQFVPTTTPKLPAACTLSRIHLFVTLLVIFTAVYNYLFVDGDDPFKCRSVLKTGRWLDKPSRWDKTTIPNNWQPDGCMANAYRKDEIIDCFHDRRVLFVGDSTIREVFWATAKRLSPNVDSSLISRHEDAVVDKHGVRLEFVWDPYMNGTRLQSELLAYGNREEVVAGKPALMLVGGGLWHATYEPVNTFKLWKDQIDQVAQYMRNKRHDGDLTAQDLLLLAPVTVPAFSKLPEEKKKAIKPENVAVMNQYLQQLAEYSGLSIAFNFNMMTRGLDQAFDESGIHTVDAIAAKKADNLLNLRCNAIIHQDAPFDKTCCIRYSAPNLHQLLVLLGVLMVIPAINLLRNQNDGKPASGILRYVPSKLVVHSIFVIGLAVVYCFYADRTQIFGKSHKQFKTGQFTLLSLIVIIIGFASAIRSSGAGRYGSDEVFLNRDQTDEWKGWMQFFILIYHITGASSVPAIFSFIRVLVAGYLFMTGYGHTLYFLRKKDYSFRRIATVLVRLNLLSVTLPYVMNTTYAFYYFAPLVSFWFLVVVLVLRFRQESNDSPRFLLTKTAVAAFTTFTIIHLPYLLEFFLGTLHLFTRIAWSAPQLRYRLSLDAFIVYVGILVAALIHNPSSIPASIQALHPNRIPISVGTLIAYFLFASTLSKSTYETLHPFLSPFPILAYITLRNATPDARQVHSKAMSWLGRFSLETFTLQFHIWMAADTRGILDLGFLRYQGGWWFNLLLITIAFIYVSRKVATATEILTTWIVGKAPESRTRRRPKMPVFDEEDEGRMEEGSLRKEEKSQGRK